MRVFFSFFLVYKNTCKKNEKEGTKGKKKKKEKGTFSNQLVEQ